MTGMQEESFYGVKLGGPNGVLEDTWKSVNADNEPNPYYKFVLKQIVLGHNARGDEFNVVEVTAPSLTGSLSIPIAVLKGNINIWQTSHNIDFPAAPITFRLTNGHGPVYVHGNIVLNYEPPPQEAEDESMEMPEEEETQVRERGSKRYEEETQDRAIGSKRKMDNTGPNTAHSNNSKKQKHDSV